MPVRLTRLEATEMLIGKSSTRTLRYREIVMTELCGVARSISRKSLFAIYHLQFLAVQGRQQFLRFGYIPYKIEPMNAENVTNARIAKTSSAASRIVWRCLVGLHNLARNRKAVAMTVSGKSTDARGTSIVLGAF